MKCQRCNRPLKNHTDSGMGEVCRMKAALGGDTDAPKPRIELVFDNRRGHRNYLVYADGKRIFVSVTAKVIRCFSCNAPNCEHSAIIRLADTERFPADYPQIVPAMPVAPRSNVAEFRLKREVAPVVEQSAGLDHPWIENLLAA